MIQYSDLMNANETTPPTTSIYSQNTTVAINSPEGIYVDQEYLYWTNFN